MWMSRLNGDDLMPFDFQSSWALRKVDRRTPTAVGVYDLIRQHCGDRVHSNSQSEAYRAVQPEPSTLRFTMALSRFDPCSCSVGLHLKNFSRVRLRPMRSDCLLLILIVPVIGCQEAVQTQQSTTASEVKKRGEEMPARQADMSTSAPTGADPQHHDIGNTGPTTQSSSSQTGTARVSTSFGFSFKPGIQIEKQKSRFTNDDRTLVGLFSDQRQQMLHIIGSHDFKPDSRTFIEGYVAGLRKSYAKNGKSIAIESEELEPVAYMNRSFECYVIDIKSPEGDNQLLVLNHIHNKDCLTFVVLQANLETPADVLNCFIVPD